MPGPASPLHNGLFVIFRKDSNSHIDTWRNKSVMSSWGSVVSRASRGRVPPIFRKHGVTESQPSGTCIYYSNGMCPPQMDRKLVPSL